jgi:hypothetical protein
VSNLPASSVFCRKWARVDFTKGQTPWFCHELHKLHEFLYLFLPRIAQITRISLSFFATNCTNYTNLFIVFCHELHKLHEFLYRFFATNCTNYTNFFIVFLPRIAQIARISLSSFRHELHKLLEFLYRVFATNCTNYTNYLRAGRQSPEGASSPCQGCSPWSFSINPNG